jgi:hypothetical protein
MLKNIINHTKHLIHKVSTHSKRSPQWAKLEKEFIKEHPTCAACGSSKRLNVHHKIPFSFDPSKELDPNNLITLCMDKFCHLYIGHLDNFKLENEFVETDALAMSKVSSDIFDKAIKELVDKRRVDKNLKKSFTT